MQWLNYLQCLPSYRNSLTVLCIRNYCALIMWIIHMVSWTWKTILLSNHVHCFCESTMDDITRVCLLMKFQLLLEALQEMLTGRWQTDTHTHKSCCTVLFTGSPPRPIFSAYIIILFTFYLQNLYTSVITVRKATRTIFPSVTGSKSNQFALAHKITNLEITNCSCQV